MELWDILTSKFGQNYYRVFTNINTTGGTYDYQLPYDIKDLQTVDAPINASAGIYWTILPFTDRDRNSYSNPTAISLPYAWTNLRYQLQGQNLAFMPQTATLPSFFRISYTPAAPILVQTLPTAWVASTVYAAGSFCTATYTVNGNSVTQVFLALNGGISGTTQPTFNIPGTTTDGTGSNQITWVYKGPSTLFATSFDGISGWEDYVIIDAALKCAAKQEQDCSVFMAQKQALMQRIEWASANRQGSDPIVAPYGWGHNGDSGNGT